jgi:predicted lipid-binding transport protein (Tim44 family)
MRRTARTLAAFAALALVLAPALADARPGGGFSSGSRGSRSYSAPPTTRTAPDAARPMDRSMTPAPSTQPGLGSASPGMAGAATRRPGMFGGGFGGALMGGLIGVGIGGLLFGHGLFGGISGLGGILGLLLQIGIVVLLVRFGLKLWRNRSQPAMAGGPRPDGARPAAMSGMGMARQAGGPLPMGGAAPSTPVNVTEGDFKAFESLLREVNAAWSSRDMQALSRVATPEMVNYFTSDLRDLEARGWRNQTSDVRLESGDLSEAWREGNAEYATVAMRFSLIDVTYDSANRVVEGSPDRRDTATEVWTFVRGPAGAWKLSAIQQTR